MTAFHVLGIDPGFASLGYAVMLLSGDGEGDEVVEVGVFHTTKSSKKTKVRASDDNLRRARLLYGMLDTIFCRFDINILCAETMSFPRNASTAGKLAMCWGVLAAIVESRSMPVVQASPQSIKDVLTGRKDASKQDVRDALEERYPGQFDSFVEASNKGDLEHGFDAAGAIVACLESDVVQVARKLSL